MMILISECPGNQLLARDRHQNLFPTSLLCRPCPVLFPSCKRTMEAVLFKMKVAVTQVPDTFTLEDSYESSQSGWSFTTHRLKLDNTILKTSVLYFLNLKRSLLKTSETVWDAPFRSMVSSEFFRPRFHRNFCTL